MMKHINILLMCLALLATACSNGNKSEGIPTVVTGIPPLADIAKRIAGDSVKVVTLLSANSDPETFEPSVGDMKKVYSSDIFFTTGSLPFEQALVKKIKSNSKSLQIVNAGEGVELLYGTHGDCPHAHKHAEADSHDHHHHEGEADPHTWSSIPNMRIMAGNIAKALAELSPESEEYFNANLESLLSELDSIDDKFNSDIKPQSFLIWHPSLSYFARDYGLEQIAVGSENKDLSVKSLQKQIDKASNANVNAMFLQKNFDSSQAENIARQLDIKVVEINPMAEDWLTELKKVKDALE